MDSAAVEKAGLEPLQHILDKIDAVKTQADFYDLMAYFKLTGLSYPWAAGVGVDDKNSNAYIFNLSQGGLGMPDRDYYLKSDSASASLQGKYKEHVATMLQMSGMDAEKAKEAASNIYDLEHKLAEKQMSRADQRIPENVYNKMSRTTLWPWPLS